MRTCPSCGYVNEPGDAADVSYCLSPGCGAWLPAPQREPARPEPDLTPTARPRIPARALTPILGIGVVALATVTILMAANNAPRAQMLEPPAPHVIQPVNPATESPSPVDSGAATTSPGDRVSPSPSASKPARPRNSSAPPPAQPNSGLWQSGDDVMIPDGTSEGNSVITVTGRPGSAPADLRVWVDVKHKAPADLAIDLIGPTGAKFSLKAPGGSGINLNQTYTVNVSSQPCNGAWRLRVRDVNGEGSVGYLDNWSIDFS